MVAFSPTREVFSSHKNKDLVSLSDRELTTLIEGKKQARNMIPMAPRRQAAVKQDLVYTRRKKKLAIQCLLQDKAMTTELIRLYSNNAEMK